MIVVKVPALVVDVDEAVVDPPVAVVEVLAVFVDLDVAAVGCPVPILEVLADALWLMLQAPPF